MGIRMMKTKKKRCDFGFGFKPDQISEKYIAYHDLRWCKPEHRDRAIKLFEEALRYVDQGESDEDNEVTIRYKIAEMNIEGTSMGVAKTLRHLNDYRGDDPQARGLGEALLKAQQDGIEQMKPFL